jgi:hypothetical protein
MIFDFETRSSRLNWATQNILYWLVQYQRPHMKRQQIWRSTIATFTAIAPVVYISYCCMWLPYLGSFWNASCAQAMGKIHFSFLSKQRNWSLLCSSNQTKITFLFPFMFIFYKINKMNSLPIFLFTMFLIIYLFFHEHIDMNMETSIFVFRLFFSSPIQRISNLKQ